jgi:hypothetical protein
MPAPPMYRPGEGIGVLLEDKSAVRQSIVRLRVLPILLVKLHHRPWVNIPQSSVFVILSDIFVILSEAKDLTHGAEMLYCTQHKRCNSI